MRKILFFIPFFLWTCGGGGGSTAPEPPQLPTVTNIEVTTLEDTPTTFAFTGTDPLNSALSYSVSTQPQHGTISISGGAGTYTPNANYNGQDVIAYIATSINGNSNIGTIIITITPVDDEPNTMDVSVTTDEDNPVTMTLEAEEVDGQTIQFNVTGNPSNGSVTLSGTTATYTPNQDWFGTDTFNFEATDDKTFRRNVVTATITVNAVNDAPVANDVTASTQSRMNNMRQAVTITLDVTDVEGDELTYSLVSDVSNGTTSLSGNVVTYTPTENYDGTDTFTYKANDGTADSNTATGEITITDTNQAPIANDMSLSLDREGSIDFTLDASDQDGDSLSKSIVSQPENGTLLPGTGLNYIYTPNSGYFGTDSFTYKVNDGTSDSEVKTVSFDIDEVIRTFTNDTNLVDLKYVALEKDFNSNDYLLFTPDGIIRFDENLNFVSESLVSDLVEDGYVYAESNGFIVSQRSILYGEEKKHLVKKFDSSLNYITAADIDDSVYNNYKFYSFSINSDGEIITTHNAKDNGNIPSIIEMDQDLNIINEVMIPEFSNGGATQNIATGAIKLSNGTYFMTFLQFGNSANGRYANLNSDGSFNWVMDAYSASSSDAFATSTLEIDEKIIFSAYKYGWIALDFNGNPLWQRTRPPSSEITQLKKSSDGNFFILGTQGSEEYKRGKLVKADISDGSVLWEFEIYTLNNTPSFLSFYIKDVIETANSDIICLIGSRHGSDYANYVGLIKLDSNGTKLLP